MGQVINIDKFQKSTVLNERKQQAAYDIICKKLRLSEAKQLQLLTMTKSDTHTHNDIEYRNVDIIFTNFDDISKRKVILFTCLNPNGSYFIQSDYLDKKDMKAIERVK
jgi:hypothetical protein